MAKGTMFIICVHRLRQIEPIGHAPHSILYSAQPPICTCSRHMPWDAILASHGSTIHGHRTIFGVQLCRPGEVAPSDFAAFIRERDLHSEIVPKNTAHDAPCHTMPPTPPPVTSGVPQPEPGHLEGGASPLSVAKKRENGCLVLNLNLPRELLTKNGPRNQAEGSLHTGTAVGVRAPKQGKLDLQG